MLRFFPCCDLCWTATLFPPDTVLLRLLLVNHVLFDTLPFRPLVTVNTQGRSGMGINVAIASHCSQITPVFPWGKYLSRTVMVLLCVGFVSRNLVQCVGYCFCIQSFHHLDANGATFRVEGWHFQPWTYKGKRCGKIPLQTICNEVCQEP